MNAMPCNEITEDTQELSQKVAAVVKKYLQTNIGAKKTNNNLYQLVIEEVEKTLFRTVMELNRYNQSKTARILGVSRGNLRTKLKNYYENKFIGSRAD